MTKTEERKIVDQIEALIESAGPDSYIAHSFLGCCDCYLSSRCDR